MTRTCYLCAAEIIDAGERSACPECGLLHPFIPAVEPAVSAPAGSPRPDLPAAGQLTGGAGATSSLPSPAGSFIQRSARVQVRADAAPGQDGRHRESRARHQDTIPRIWQAGADTAPGARSHPQVSRGRTFFPAVDYGDVLGAVALFVALGAGMFLAAVMQ